MTPEQGKLSELVSMVAERGGPVRWAAWNLPNPYDDPEAHIDFYQAWLDGRPLIEALQPKEQK